MGGCTRVAHMANDLPEGAPVMLRMSVERENGYLSWLGVQMGDIEFGEANLTIPFDERFTDKEADPPTVHDGIVTTLVEQTTELAIRTTMPDPVNDRVDLLSTTVNFLDEAAHDLEATASVVDTGDGSAVAEASIESRDPQGTPVTVASGQGVFRID
ncbi:PaaI family thioesterase [Halorientalis pallida]|uniref:PaaI family thioesterase n=2 Tax=Halorientalis pallida TaxID=2479928 RepID=A0A498KRS1_9EURY|nr:PaaI family thioesterase [Halorientalis pallida]